MYSRFELVDSGQRRQPPFSDNPSLALHTVSLDLTALPHPQHSPNLEPSAISLFRLRKVGLRGETFPSNDCHSSCEAVGPLCWCRFKSMVCRLSFVAGENAQLIGGMLRNNE